MRSRSVVNQKDVSKGPKGGNGHFGVNWKPYVLGACILGVGIIATAIFSRRVVNQLGNSSKWLNQTFEVRNDLRTINSLIDTTELDISEYVRTSHQPPDADRIAKDLAKLTTKVGSINALVSARPEQLRRLNKLKLDLERLLHDSSNPEMANHPRFVQPKLDSLDALKSTVLEMIAAEEQHLKEQHDTSDSALKSNALLVLTTNLISAFIVALIFYLLFRDARRRFLLEAELSQSRQVAENASRSKSEFLANVSHEIRTPLNGIMGMLSLLSATELSVKQRDFTEGIKKSAAILLSLINDILDFSKIEAGRMELELVDFDLNSLMGDVGDSFRPLFESKSLKFSIILDAAERNIFHGDPTRIRQILGNLLSNAFKFTESGAVTLQVKQFEASDGRLELSFAVTDTGIGMNPDVIEKLFKVFSQADASTARRFGGTGLGLAICKRLCQLMGGEIVARSTPGQGSTFEFFVCVAEGKGPLTDVNTKEMISVGLLSREERSKFTVLIAEDNVINQEITKAMVENAGYQSLTVANGHEVISVLSDRSFDAILMDCHMPEMDGYAATQTLRSRGVEIPIVALTAKAFAEDRERCFEAGMNDYLSKPISETSLIQKLDSFMEQKREASRDSSTPLLESDILVAPVLDEAIIQRLERLDKGASAQLVARLIAMYLGSVDRAVAELRVAAETNLSGELALKAHALKSSSGNLGATRIVQILEGLECGERSDLRQAIADLELEVGRFCQELRAYKVGVSNPGRASS